MQLFFIIQIEFLLFVPEGIRSSPFSRAYDYSIFARSREGFLSDQGQTNGLCLAAVTGVFYERCDALILKLPP
jgi:hypothetical protein